MLKRIFLFFIIGVFFSFYIPLSYAADLDSLSIDPVNNRGGQQSIYILNFSILDTIPPGAQWEINFPAGFDLSKVLLAGSNSINGGFSVQVTGQNILISRSGQGFPLRAGINYDLAFANVNNPIPGDYDIIIKILDQNGTSISNDYSFRLTIVP